MKRIILTFTTAILLASCADKESEEKVTNISETIKEVTETPEMLKSYVGNFEAERVNDHAKSPSYSNKINVSVTSLKEGKINGYSIIAGNQQIFQGDYTLNDGKFDVKALEPGNDKHDGRFEFMLDTVAKRISGKWYCFDTTIDVPVRSFDLDEKSFKYDPNSPLPEILVGMPFYDPKFDEIDGGVGEMITKDVLKFNPSVKELKKADVANMFKGDLEVLRNSIYARHGYSFRNRKMRYLFDQYAEWYMPASLNVEKELTELEKKNIDLLKRYENHAAKYYDEFGR